MVTSIALGILALGLGANTALFSVIDAVLLRSLPYPAADRLVVLRLFNPEYQERYQSFPVNVAHIAVWRERCASCEDLAAINTLTTTLTGSGEAEQLRCSERRAPASSGSSVSRRSPAAGSCPKRAAWASNAVAVISQALWMRGFGGAPSAVGRTIQLDGEPVEIVGVLPAGAPLPGPQQLGDLVRLPRRLDVFRPMAPSADTLRSPGDLNYGVVARVRPGVTAEALGGELDALEPAIAQQTGDDGHKRAVVQPLQQVVTRHARSR